ncbi:DNA-directed RNA polymerase subunit L [Candidatus Woesearchaeota archaeon CG10_big_fil_rev_8_21_14_0_10_34_12]|nr:MAG: DNA-directed RNA polymerase subunit L [Candidatus Woesearchaeota archaeon CG10_big_fil_rev_8_21_14_0_10_34_12]
MQYKILKDEKEELEVEIDNLTVVEILREELNKNDDVKLAVWKRDHPSKNPVLLIQGKGKPAKKLLQDAANRLIKNNEKLITEFKKAK